MHVAEDQLLQHARTGDLDALSQLIERHGPNVRRRFKQRIPQRWQSVLSLDDLMQETYTDAFLHIAEFEPGRANAFESWLATIAKRNLLDALKMLGTEKRGGNRRRVQAPENDSYVQLHERLGGAVSSPSRKVARSEARGALESAMIKLQADHRQVIQLYDIEGRPMREVGQLMNRRPGACFMLRARAHRLLAQRMGTSSRFLSDSS